MESVPTLRYDLGSIVSPGDRLGSVRRIIPGAGTYMRGGHVYSSAIGTLICESTVGPSSKNDPYHVVSVELESGRQYASSQVLSVGQVVLAKVGRIMMQMATVEIIAADDIGSLKEHHSGVIRKEDIRAGATEEVQVHQSFRPGDIILAKIISLGDSRRYFLSTAETSLGVIKAISSSTGKCMVPISWNEIECPDTKIRESRKCAKPKM